MKLTPEAAQKLFDQGAFAVITDLPEGSEIGIDGDNHVIRAFSGFKMIPPGPHLLSWTIPSSSSASSSGLAIRKGIFHTFLPSQTLLLKYSPESEDLLPSLTDETTGEILNTTLDLDHLKSLDAGMAPYPFVLLPLWRNLSTALTPASIRRVLGPQGRVDGLSESPGDEEPQIAGTVVPEEEEGAAGGQMKFSVFDLKRSWRKGAVGEEVTRYSRDKSWLFLDILESQFSNDPTNLLADLQLSFLLFLHIQNFSSLLAYKRLLSLFSRSTALLSPSHQSPVPQSALVAVYAQFINTLQAQLAALPEGFFTTDAAGTGLEEFWVEELGELGRGLGGVGVGEGVREGWEGVTLGWEGVRGVAGRKFGWELPAFAGEGGGDDDEEEDEEGEYAPVVVEM